MKSIVKSSIVQGLAVFSLYFLLTTWFTWPLLRDFTTHNAGGAGDNYVYLWNLWWIKHSIIVNHDLPFYSDYLFYPYSSDLTFHTLTLLNGIISIPFQGVFSLHVIFNALTFLSFTLSGLFGYIFVNHYVKDRGAAFVGGLIFAFAPFHLQHSTGNIGSIQWLPLFLYFFVRSLEEKRLLSPAVVWAGVFLGFNLLSAHTYFIYSCLLILLFLAYHVAQDYARSLHLMIKSSLVVCISLFLTFPFVASLVHALASGTFNIKLLRTGIDTYVLDASSLLSVGDNAIGVVVLALVILGVYAHRQRNMYWFVALAGLFIIFSFGKTLHFNGQDTGVPMPYIFQWLPVLNNLRAPDRFIVLVMLCLSVVASFGVRHLGKRFRYPLVVTVIVAFAVSVEYHDPPFSTNEIRVPAVYETIAADDSAQAVLDIPFFLRDGHGYVGTVADEEVLYQTVHGKRMFGGNYSRIEDSTHRIRSFFNLPLIRSLLMWELDVPILMDDWTSEAEMAKEVIRLMGIDYIVFHKKYPNSRFIFDWLVQSLPLTLEYFDDDIIAYKTIYEKSSGYSVDCGKAASIASLMSGWINGQRSPGHSFAWMHGESSTFLVNLEGGRAYDLAFTLRPHQSINGASLVFRINDKEAGTVVPRTGWNTYRFALDPTLIKPGLNRISLVPDKTVVLEGPIGSIIPPGLVSTYLKGDISYRSGKLSKAAKQVFDDLSRLGYFIRPADWEQDVSKFKEPLVSFAVDRIDLVPSSAAND